MMTKVILIFWVMTNTGLSEPQTIGADGLGFTTMEACQIAAESLTEPNPKDTTSSYAVIAKCVTVPR